jgi:hypothetical protein
MSLYSSDQFLVVTTGIDGRISTKRQIEAGEGLFCHSRHQDDFTPKPQRREPETRNRKPKTKNPKIRKPKTQNRNPETRNPETRKPENRKTENRKSNDVRPQFSP